MRCPPRGASIDDVCAGGQFLSRTLGEATSPSFPSCPPPLPHPTSPCIRSTCFATLLLPEYATEEKLRAKLFKAIEESSGFGLR